MRLLFLAAPAAPAHVPGIENVDNLAERFTDLKQGVPIGHLIGVSRVNQEFQDRTVQGSEAFGLG
jgi:hypothetical protein